MQAIVLINWHVDRLINWQIVDRRFLKSDYKTLFDLLLLYKKIQ